MVLTTYTPPPPHTQPSPLFLLCVCAPPQDTPPCPTHRKHKTIAIESICTTSQACVSHVTDQSVCPTANKHRTQNSLCRGRRLHPPGTMNAPCAQGTLNHTGCQPYMTTRVHIHTQKHIRTHVLTCTHVCTPPRTHTSEQHCSLVLLAPYFTTTAKIKYTYCIHLDSLRNTAWLAQSMDKQTAQQLLHSDPCCTRREPYKKQHPSL